LGPNKNDPNVMYKGLLISFAASFANISLFLKGITR
jgi:hypothetical protein